MKKKALAAVLVAAVTMSMAGCGSKQAASTDGGSKTESEAGSDAAAADSGEKKTLRVGMECAYAPYNWTQSDDSNGAVPISGSSDYAYGYDVMMAKRLESVDFTDPYYYASIVTLVKKDGPYKDAKGLADLKGATATSQINTVWYDTCLDQIEDVNKLPAYETTGTMLVSLESGACDLICTDQPTAMAACVAYPDMEMLDFSSSDDNYQVSDEEINIGISVKKGNQELVDEINSVLEKMTKEDYEQMMNEAISVQPLSE